MSPLIDPTEMFLRTVLELEEERIPALRVRLAERLALSVPATSERVARLRSQQLLRLDGRTLGLTEGGRELAVSVMRKHRLVERLLVDVIGLAWEHVHVEACRWEHVVSDAVERRLADLLGQPTHSPFGNPIPGMHAPSPPDGLVTLAAAAATSQKARIAYLSEWLQGDVETMRMLAEHGLRPDAMVRLHRDGTTVSADAGDGQAALTGRTAALIYVQSNS
ncbi:MAG: metal-dependent transcriptional regulator [Egibacteraceae bacterium]